jgi:hypothetical protein
MRSIAKTEIVAPGEVAGLVFGARKKTGYIPVLEELLHAPAGSALKVERVASRFQIGQAAKRMGINVEFAESGGSLYVRVAGAGSPAQAGTPAPLNARATTAIDPLTAKIRMLLKDGPMTMRRLMGGLPGGVAEKLKERVFEMAREGLLENEDGMFRLREVKLG